MEAHDRRAVAVKADVCSQQQLNAAVAAGLAELGRMDILHSTARRRACPSNIGLEFLRFGRLPYGPPRDSAKIPADLRGIG